jgi:hypothetical protein
MALHSKEDDFVVNGSKPATGSAIGKKSVLLNSLIENILGMPVTTRSLITFRKLVEQ